nr:phosphotransferase [bacterium]
MLFKATVDGWAGWGSVFCDAVLFAPLVEAILLREGLPVAPVENLTPGTNAVFAAGDYVVKIFAPISSGLDTRRDFEVELAVGRHAGARGIPVPRVVASGQLEDAYLFRYLVQQRVAGKSALQALPDMQACQRRNLALQVKAMLRCLNRPAPGLLPGVDIVGRAIDNPRLKGLPDVLVGQLAALARMQQATPRVLVHGDITGDNILIRPDGQAVIIDLADACLAPASYEMAALGFELFRWDRDMVEAFAGQDGVDGFIADSLRGLALHDFAGGMIRDFVARCGESLSCVQSVQMLHALIKRTLYGHDKKSRVF